MLFIGTECINKDSSEFANYKERLCPSQLPSQCSIKMVKALSFRFQKYFGPFTIFLLERSSEIGFLYNYQTTFFGVRNFRNISQMRFILFSKCSKFNIDFKIQSKLEKTFFLSAIIAYELVALNCSYKEGNTFHR